MDIHPPKVPHSWRELTKEIAIIVVGVLIALSAEQLVDSSHWRQKVDAARDSMRRELLSDDGPQVYQRGVMHPCLVQHLDAIRAAVEANKARAEIAMLIDSYWLQFLTYDSVAHQEATASDVASHMPRDEMQRFDVIYAQMPPMDRIAEREGVDFSQLHMLKHSGGPLTSNEQDRVLAAVEALRNDDLQMWLSAKVIMPDLRSLGSLDLAPMRRIMRGVREHYGACARDLPDDFPKNLPPEA